LNFNNFYHGIVINNLQESLSKKCIYEDDDIKYGLCEHIYSKTPKIDKKYKHVKCDCKKGSLVMWSSKVFHRGGQNYGDKDRPIFYITLMGDNGKNPMDFDSTIEDASKKIYIKDL
jgi:ectoine hydroxylase-related dioxygenase (phytanoyl-CoA dioxygenase family)